MATTSFFRSPPNQRLQNSLINTQTLTFFVKKQILVLRLVIYVNSTTTMLLPLQHGQKLVWVLPPVSSLCAKLFSFSATCAQHLSPRHISRWGQRSISYRTSLKRTATYRNVPYRTVLYHVVHTSDTKVGFHKLVQYITVLTSSTSHNQRA